MRARALVGALLLTLTLSLAVPAWSLTELDAARDRRAAIEERLATSAGDLEGLEETIHDAEVELAALDDEDARLRRELVEVESRLATRTRLAFMLGDRTSVEMLLSGQDPTEVAERAVLLESLAMRDRAAGEVAASLRLGLAQNRELREGRLAELAVLRADLEEQLALLEDDLSAARTEERFFELKARRQREVANGFMSGIYSCPVGDPVFFADTWGAPRSGGRSHKGVDMMAPHGTPIYAIHHGTVTRMNNGGLGGISLYMFGDDGNQYYYTHLQGYAAGIGVGTRVEPGDLVAYNGDTGNARGGAPHLHFEVHPGGGGAVNPYPYVAAACGR